MTFDIVKLMQGQNFDHVSFASMNLETGQKFFIAFEDGKVVEKSQKYYDLASLTKPLTLSFTIHQYPELIDDLMICALCEHKAGLPSGGYLPRDNWYHQINAYKINMDSDTLYSDYGALRCQIEIEKKMNDSLYNLAAPLWDKEICHHTEFEAEFEAPLACPPTGYRGGKKIIGVVHDPNAFNLYNQKLSHAGLFGTTQGVLNSLGNLWQKTKVLEHIEKRREKVGYSQRFLLGWDTVQNQATTLAGSESSLSTFGHLGFTGTSMWIDPMKKFAKVILTNATCNYWYAREGLNDLRKILNNLV